ncbi:MAG: 4-alpha-glucanotransferase, partial [Puniceicoccaceae bacterium]|nr:4-alpha-glucanotransferase [Puniceicoccaceae bacterium]
MDRSAGLILHPSALPSPYGIGNFGSSARQWIDALSACGFKLWQMCPTG